MELPNAVNSRDVHLIQEEIRKEALDIYNRLHSVNEDIEFINQVHAEYVTLPLIPNLRCGAWYTDPKLSQNRFAYFKSTDGHNNNWSFNLRRPNLHLLPLLVQHRGLVIVDSTRSGKRMPDALSKTIPIWCEVVNRATKYRHGDSVFGGKLHALYTPPSSVSPQEHHQIELRLDAWAELLATSSYDLPVLCAPLRPIWITPGASVLPVLPAPNLFITILCVCASRQIDLGVDKRSAGYAYIQGSADDHELWGKGLTPELFWQHRSKLLQANRNNVASLIADVLSESQHQLKRPECDAAPSPVLHIGGRVQLCKLSQLPDLLPTKFDTASAAGLIEQRNIAYVLVSSVCRDSANGETVIEDRHCPPVLHLQLPEGKRGQMILVKDVLPRATPFIREHLCRDYDIVIGCDTGKDTCVGVALVTLQLFFEDDGRLSVTRAQNETKASIRTRLQWIISSQPHANPSRTTLKRVNEFLLS